MDPDDLRQGNVERSLIGATGRPSRSVSGPIPSRVPKSFSSPVRWISGDGPRDSPAVSGSTARLGSVWPVALTVAFAVLAVLVDDVDRYSF